MSAAATNRFVCVHGHFYQPPRENPWLETVEVQDSAAPSHDWNERVSAECYAPNTCARLLDEQGAITALRNNYNSISFNFGPTLLAWMERAQPNVYAQILLADQVSARRFGRGNALAQAYGHCIMPLASRRDQLTQVRWGIADFTHRFGRRPDGMWLPETAVDRTTLAVLAEHGIRFTILAPSQAARVRYAGHQWEEVPDGGIDCLRPYRCVVAPGREIILFFYDADLAHAVAFGGLLNDGRDLARRLTAASLGRPAPPDGQASLVHIATDGESYGHHHRFGEMALAAAIEALEREGQVQLTNYATYLDRVKVVDEVEIRDNTSWSCAHGVERWRANCGCNSGSHPGWQQAWRTPLRQALDWLKAQADVIFEQQGSQLLRDPWAARDAYVSVVLQRDAAHQEAFVAQHALAPVEGRGRSRLWKLLELQRNALLSFTSCGWFFDEPTGIETVQVLAYAARALQLAGELGVNLEPEFVQHLQLMRSNLPIHGDGREIYRHLVRPYITDTSRVAAHFAMNSLFEPPRAKTRVYAYRATSLERSVERGGAASLAVGRARLLSELTEESTDYTYAALHLGGHDMHCAVARSESVPDYGQLQTALRATFMAEPLSELVRRIDHVFGGSFLTLRHVFLEERRRILDQVTAEVTAGCTQDYERMVTQNRRLLDFLAQALVPLPEALRVATTFVVQRRLEQTVAGFVAGADTADAALAVWADAQRWGVTPVMDGVRQRLETALVDAVAKAGDGGVEAHVAHAHAILNLAVTLAPALNTWEAQNQYYVLVTPDGHGRWDAAARAELRRLGERLRFRLPQWDARAERAA